MADFKKTIKFSLDGVEQSINNIAELSKFLKQAKDNVDTLDDTKLAGLRDSLNEIGGQLDEVGKKNKNITEAFNDFTKTVNNKIPTNSIKNFKVQIQSLEEELEGLEVGSDSFKSIKKQADNLKIALESIEQNASETRQQFVDLGKGVAESLVSSVGTFKAFTAGQEEADKITAKFAETLALVETVEKAAIAIKEIDKFITTQAALATAAATAATTANTAATVTNTGATGVAATAQLALNNAYNATIGTLKKLYVVLLANPITAITALVVTAAAAWYSYGETAREALDKVKEGQQKELELFEKQFEKAKLLLAKKRETDAASATFSKNDIDRQNQQFTDEIKALKFFLEQKELVNKKFLETEAVLEKKFGLGKNLTEAEKNKERQELQKQRLDADIRFLNAEIELRQKEREQSEFNLDVARKTASLLEDIDIEKLNAKKTFTNQFVLNDKLEKKELNDLLLEFQKGEIKNINEYNNKKKLITEKYNNIELDLKQQLIDKLTDLERKKEDSDLARTLKSSQIKTRDIQADLKKQEEAIIKQREVSDKRALEDRNKALKEVGDLTTEAGKKLAKAIEADYQEQLKNNKDTQDEQTKTVKEGIDARVIETELAAQQLVNIESSANQDILDDTRESYDARIKANDILLTRQIETIEQLRDIKLKDKTLTQEQIDVINEEANAEIVAATKIVAAQNKVFKGRKKLFEREKDFDLFIAGLTQIEESLTNIANLGINTSVNAVISSIAGIGGAIKTVVSDIDELNEKEFDTIEEKTAAFTKAYGEAAISIVASINSAIQAVTDAQVLDLETKLGKVRELKDQIDEDLQKTKDDIRELQSNLAEAQLEDRERLIKKIAKQREAEKRLADQKAKAIKDENDLLAKQKELKKQAFIANKFAAGIQAAINTAIGITAALTNPVTAPILVPIIAGLGAVQIAAIAAAPIPEFKTGGFTSKGDKNEVAGIVHKNEYVIPAWQVESPKFSATIAELEQSRLAGFAGGGFVTQQNNNSDFLQVMSQQNQVIAKIVERPTVVSVQEIQSVGAKVNRTKVKATL